MRYNQHFSPQLIARMTHVHSVLQDVLPSRELDDWIGGFVGELRPEHELRIFEAIAAVYLDVLTGIDATPQQKQRLYTALVTAASGFAVAGIDDGLPLGAPGLDELSDRFDRAFALQERPELRA